MQRNKQKLAIAQVDHYKMHFYVLVVAAVADCFGAGILLIQNWCNKRP